MPQQISKKIFIYLLLFFVLVTIDNKSFRYLTFPTIESIKVTGLDFNENKTLLKNLEFLKSKNIIFLDKMKLEKQLYENSMIEKFSIFKVYPSTLIIKIEKTKFLAHTNKDGVKLIIGSNGNFIKSNNSNLNIPFIFGNFEISEFLNLKKIIEDSNFDYNEIKNFFTYPSRRWDIETKKGVLIMLPREDLISSLNLKSNILKKKKFKNVKSFDLRQKNQVIVNEN